MASEITLTLVGRFDGGGEAAAEIAVFDPVSDRLFITNGEQNRLDIVDVSDPASPTFVAAFDLTLANGAFAGFVAGGLQSVAVNGAGVVAVAISNDDGTANGVIALLDSDGTLLNTVEVGNLPDMVTFSPDGNTILVANEGEPSGNVDPQGSISIIDISGGVNSPVVTNLDFTAFDGREVELRNDGVRIFPGNAASVDLEPEFIAVSPDGTQAFVTLQEANSVAAIDLSGDTPSIIDIFPLQPKDYSRDLPVLTEFDFDNLPTLVDGGEILLGGFSGLHFTGVNPDNGNLTFITVPDRGPNGDAANIDGDPQDERQFLEPTFQAQVVSFEVNETTGEVTITDRLFLTRADGTTPITGLPNIEGVDEDPVDGDNNPLPFDAFGADLEGVVIDSRDDSFWMVDEYRPAIYHFSSTGVLINRFVPEGTADLAGNGAVAGDFGDETLPEVYNERRANRGFEAVALDEENGIVYAFIQTPLANPNNATSNASDVIRILGVDTATGLPVQEFIYQLEKPADSVVDKIGDAVFLGDGRMLVVERDSGLTADSKKFVFTVDLKGATNVLDLPQHDTLEQLSIDELDALGIQAADKVKLTNLPSLGYLPTDKVEGITVLDDGRIAVLNDNDFGIVDGIERIALGIIDFSQSNGLDGSDRDNNDILDPDEVFFNDNINIGHQPVFGMLMPDAIASFTANGETFYITANEGDARDEVVRIKDLEDDAGLTLDPEAFPDGAQLITDPVLGRLEVSTIDGDIDGDGDLDQLFTLGGRSFSILDAAGNLVFDSGDLFERIVAQAFPERHNSQFDTGDDDAFGQADDEIEFESRSDNKGVEPESVVTGEVNGRTLAFVGLERTGGIMIFDVTDPTAPRFSNYVNADVEDVSPEGLKFITAADSPNGQPMLLVSNELSGTTTLLQIGEAETSLTISEIMFNPASSEDDWEWIEIVNNGQTVIDLAGYVVDDFNNTAHTGANIAGGFIAPGEAAILFNADDITAEQFQAAWGLDINLIPVTNWTAMGLNNGNDGDQVSIWESFADYDGDNVDHANAIVTARYLGVADDGAGSFFLNDLADDPSDTANWSLSTLDGVTPVGTGVQSAPFGTNSGSDIGSPGATVGVSAEPIVATIMDIQGESQVSPFADLFVQTTGVITAIDGTSFYVQDPDGDGNDATSDGIFVFDSAGLADDNTQLAVGDLVRLTGTVQEFFPGAANTGNLPTTEFANPEIEIISRGNALPTAVLIGAAGRDPLTEVFEDLLFEGNAEPFTNDITAEDAADLIGIFDIATDGLDFWESFEGMLVTVANAQAVSPLNGFAEIEVVADAGANATGMNDRGGITILEDDFHPETVQLQLDADLIGDFSDLAVKVGDLLGDVTGVVNYSFGRFEIFVTELFEDQIVESDIAPERTNLLGGADQLTVANYNVLNLDPNDADGDTDVADGRFTLIAEQIVNNLRSPDIIALQEVQDNSGSADDGTTAADQTLQALIDAITLAGGPAYTFIDNPGVIDGEVGGEPGGNIRTAYLYNDARVDLVDGSVAALVDNDATDAFAGARVPLEATFSFNGEDVTLINVHSSSKGGSTPLLGRIQPAINGSEDERIAQSGEIRERVDAILAQDADANVIVLGDFNEFDFEDSVQLLVEDGTLKNLSETLDVEDRYSFIFQGNSQSLDHQLVTDGLAASAEIDIVHTNAEFAGGDARAADHDPTVARFTIPAQNPVTFTLQILHASDLEGGVDAIDRAANFAAIADFLEDEFANTIILSAGDNFIPGPFFSASGDQAAFRDAGVFNDVYNDFFGLEGSDAYNALREGGGRVDISIMNIIGFDAAALGNHEFDQGSEVLASIIAEDFRAPDGPAGDRWVGAQFPYLSANLDFSADANLAPLFTDQLLVNTAFQTGPEQSLAGDGNIPKIAPSTFIEVGGDRVGVVGATTQVINTISSPTGTEEVTGGVNDMAALAAVLQPVIDAMIADGINKIVLVSHLQQIALEEELAGLLSGVDVIIAGGSDTLLADNQDRLRAGDTADDTYPIVTTDADDNPTLIVSTDGEYSYVGRLVLEFDGDGHVVTDAIDADVSGAFATDAQGVTDLFGQDDPFAEGSNAALVQELVDAVTDVVVAKDGNTFGFTNVFLEGNREQVRTEETNLGNLTADANLAFAQSIDDSVVISLKNGGGIRAAIGEVDADGNPLPPQANVDAGKLEGEISQLDIENALRFNNGLSLITVTAEQLLAVLNHAVAASADGATPGQFPQIGGMQFSFDADLPAGERVQSVAALDADGGIADLVAVNGEVTGDPTRTFRMVTLDFMAGGGDGYPFPDFVAENAQLANRIDLRDNAAFTGDAIFAADGTEQDALAEFLDDNHGDTLTAFDAAETDPAEDARIQNLDEREDGIVEAAATFGTEGDDLLVGTAGTDALVGRGGDDVLAGRAGNDFLAGEDDNDILIGQGGALDAAVFDGDHDSFEITSMNARDITLFNRLLGLDGEAFDDSLPAFRVRDLEGDGGTDRVQVERLVFDDRTFTIDADGRLNLSDENDTFRGGARTEIVDGGDGNDSIDGGRGNDFLSGGAGDDTVRGGEGNDLIGGDGAAGDDDLYDGGSGNDLIVTAAANGETVTMFGGGGDDVFAILAIDADRGIDVEALIADFDSGADLIDLSGLRTGGGQVLSFEDLVIDIDDGDATIDLSGLLTEAGEAVDGALVVVGVGELVAADFSFDTLAILEGVPNFDALVDLQQAA